MTPLRAHHSKRGSRLSEPQVGEQLHGAPSQRSTAILAVSGHEPDARATSDELSVGTKTGEAQGASQPSAALLAVSGHEPDAQDTSPEKPVYADHADLPADLKGLVDELLVNGAAFQDVVQSVEERGATLTLAAVRNYYQRNLSLQEQRVRRQMVALGRLRAGLGLPATSSDADSPDVKLANAALITGFMRLDRDDPEVTLRDAERVRSASELLRLRRRILEIQEKNALAQRSYLRARTRWELARWEEIRQKVRQLKKLVPNDGAPVKISRETIERIQEIYGIVTEPPPPPAAAADRAEVE